MTAPNICAVVAGPCEVWVDTGTARALEFLGWSLSGVTIEEVAYHAPIHSDENGGPLGPPVDYQLFGHQHRIAMELSKFQDLVLARLDPRYHPDTAAGNVGVGMLLGCATATFRLLLKAPNFVRNYLAAVILDPIELSPVGSQATRARVTFTANVVTGGTLWNTTIT
jgi:hypothetical protein